MKKKLIKNMLQRRFNTACDKANYLICTDGELEEIRNTIASIAMELGFELDYTKFREGK